MINKSPKMSRYDLLDNLVHKIYKFITYEDKRIIKILITNTPTNNIALLINNIDKISEIILRYVKNLRLKKDTNRQDFITEKILNFIYKVNPEIINTNIRVADVGGGNGDIISGITKKIRGNKENFICIETNSDWIESYSFNNKNIIYKFWNNYSIDITDNYCDIVLCMVSLHHMTNETIINSMREIYRILKKGGLLLIKEHDSDCEETLKLIHWEHHLYHILETSYNRKLTNAEEYLSHSINNFKSKYDWQMLIEGLGFEFNCRKDRFLDGPLKYDVKNATKLYWDLYSKT